jgi:hypothetical protein
MSITLTFEQPTPDGWKPTVRTPEDFGIVVAKCPCNNGVPEGRILVVGEKHVFIGVRYPYEKKPFYIHVTPDLMDSTLEAIVMNAVRVSTYFASKDATIKRLEWMVLMTRLQPELRPKLQSMIDEFNELTRQSDHTAITDRAIINAMFADYMVLSTKFR